MNPDAYLRLIRGQSRGPSAALARCALTGLAWGYGMGVAVRNACYDRGWAASRRAAVPVISIGNLTLGGTGKTPMVEWVCRWLRQRELRVAILSRGYGRTAGLSDEGRVLDENLPDVPHLQGPDRARLAEIAMEELESQVLVLDDGFQHRRLARDLDIVLLDALDPFGLGWLMPRGLLREPVSGLRRAGVVVLSRADLVPAADRAAIRVRAERHAGAGKWVEARHAPRDLIASDGASLPLERLAGARVAAFCGIGNPEGFRRTLEGLSISTAGFETFPDHHDYAARDLSRLAAWAGALGVEFALTTQKDLVKLRTPRLGPIPLVALRIGLEVLEGATVLDAALTAVAMGSGWERMPGDEVRSP